MSEQQQYPFKELEKFHLFTDAPGAEGKRSRLSWSSYRGNPRIGIFTNVPNDLSKGMMNAAMNPETFLIFLNLFEDIAKKSVENKAKIDCYTLPRTPDGEERSQEKILASEVYFGRDANGILWISVVIPNRPKIKFDFKISDFHKIYKGDGTQLSEAEGSTLQTLATIKALREVFMGHMGDIRPPYIPNSSSAGNKNGYTKSTPAKSENSKEFDDLSF